VVDRESMCDSRTAVVTHDCELLKPEFGHRFDLIVRHHSFRIREMFRIAWRSTAIAATAQVGADNSEVFRQFSTDTMPTKMSFGISVEEKNRRTAAAEDTIDARI
jgi:hypothetical protein